LTTTIRRPARRLAWIVALLTLAVGGALVRLVEQRRTEAKRRFARDAASELGRRLEQELSGALSAAQVVAAVLRETGRIEQLHGLVAELLVSRPSFDSLQLAPDGVVSQVEPPESADQEQVNQPGRAWSPDGKRLPREGALKHDLLRDASLQAAAEQARSSKRPVLAGPLARERRGPVLLGLLPVFVTRGGGEERFWGFVTVSIGLRELLRTVQAEALVAAGYDYQLELTSPTSRRSVVLARSTEAGLRDPITAEVSVPTSSLTLGVAPQAGWRSPSTVATEIVLVLVATLVAALSTYRLAREPETLLQEVEVRRRHLSEAQRQLRVEVGQRVEAEERLRHDAAHDPLTLLPNRASFLGQVQAALDFTRRRPDVRAAVILIDIDRFKYLNDSLGHGIGDRLLVELAGRLQGCLGPGDALARVGGDEFAILVCDVQAPETITGLAERLLRETRLPFDLADQDVFSTISIGIAPSTPAYSRAEELLRDADTAMHRAKSLGRARYLHFDEGMRTRVVTLFQLETDLRRAIEREEFRVHYQPIVSLESGSISGFEALVRWQHPVRGFVHPMEFMPLAEETGLVVWIDRWVLGEASRRARVWQERYRREAPFFMSVNFSGRQLSQPRLVEYVEQTLQDAGLDVASLKIEITESVVMENAEAAFEVLRRLGEMGVRLSIDDFGTGYSSLSYLDHFPFHTVKIDQSFIRGRGLRDKDAGIVRTIVELAHNLGMDVIAEGVETAEQLGRLRDVACGFGQGYFFAKPLEAVEIEGLIESSPRW
jgi:diguanylate cyclase (GGDEF)-like protein